MWMGSKKIIKIQIIRYTENFQSFSDIIECVTKNKQKDKKKN